MYKKILTKKEYESYLQSVRGSVSKDTSGQPDNLNLVPGTHMVGENELPHNAN